MIEEVLSQLIAFLQEASPLVWATLIKQVYVEAVADLIWAIGLIVVCILLAKLGNYGRKESEKDKYSEWGFWFWFVYLSSAFAVLISFSLFVSALMQFVNPEFYAIRYILQQITGT